MAVLRKSLLFFMTIGVVGSGFFGPQWGFGKNKEISDPSRPIVTTADTLELDNKNKMATFSGNVVSKQEQQGKEPIIIYCDKMVIYSVEEIGKKPSPSSSKESEKKNLTQQNQVDKIVASGQVKILQGKDVATGETAVFYNADQRIVLSGNPKVWQGKNLIKGEEITVWIKENRSLVTSKGSNRVQAVIYQQEEKQGSQALTPKVIDQPTK
jgi:lipopolysaccharide export system protein LptA